MGELIQLAIYLTQEEKSDLEKFSLLRRKKISKLGREIITDWMDKQKAKIKADGHDFVEVFSSIEKVSNSIK